MLIEQKVFNLREVGEKSLDDIKNECLVQFAYDLKNVLEHIDEFREGTWNYKFIQDTFATAIKYNSKNIVFEETIHNDLNGAWSVRGTCMDVYGLEWVEGTEEHSGYYRYRKNAEKLRCSTAYGEECTCSESKTASAEENLRKFYEFFGVGEFPFMTIIIIRIGNKDHYFYTIHR